MGRRRRRAVAVGRRKKVDSLGENGDFGLRSGADGDGVGEDGRRNLGGIVNDDVKSRGIMTTTAAHVLVLE